MKPRSELDTESEVGSRGIILINLRKLFDLNYVSVFLNLNYSGHLILLAHCVLHNYNYALAFFVLENVVNLERILGISFCFDSYFEKFSEAIPGSQSDCLSSN